MPLIVRAAKYGPIICIQFGHFKIPSLEKYVGRLTLKELAQRLGHASVATTMDIYTHLFEDHMLGSEKLQ